MGHPAISRSHRYKTSLEPAPVLNKELTFAELRKKIQAAERRLRIPKISFNAHPGKRKS